MPEKPNLTQVVPGVAWSSESVGLCVRTTGGYRLEGGMNLGE